MKKFLLNLAIVLSILQAEAQNPQIPAFKKFRTDFTFGGAFSIKGGNDHSQGYGALASIEPRYNITDHIGLGLRFNYTEVLNNPGHLYDQETDVTGCLANITFTSNSWKCARFHAGTALGFNSIKQRTIAPFLTGDSRITSKKSGFAFMPRAGVEVWKLTADIFYNYTGNDNSNFAGLSLGFFIGGGKRK